MTSTTFFKPIFRDESKLILLSIHVASFCWLYFIWHATVEADGYSLTLFLLTLNVIFILLICLKLSCSLSRDIPWSAKNVECVECFATSQHEIRSKRFSARDSASLQRAYQLLMEQLQITTLSNCRISIFRMLWASLVLVLETIRAGLYKLPRSFQQIERLPPIHIRISGQDRALWFSCFQEGIGLILLPSG